MAAAALSDNGINDTGVYTFGPPRVGDRAFVSQLHPHGHVGMVKYFSAGGQIIAKYKLVNKLIASTWGLVKGISGSGFGMITDHNMEYYISHLDKALKEEAEDKAAHLLEIN